MSQVIKHVTDDILSFRVSSFCMLSTKRERQKSRNEPEGQRKNGDYRERKGKRKKRAERGEEKGQGIKIRKTAKFLTIIVIT